MKKLAMFYKKLENNKVQCELCPHYCVLENNEYGKCKVRVNEEGNLFTINYGEVTALSVDKIEKKPLYNFYPNSKILSVATYGCNFSCKFCQNYDISQNISTSKYISPESLVALINETSDSIGIAFTYNEPFIWYEYIYDVSKLLKNICPEKKIVIITNGFINKKPFLKLIKYLDAINIDLKSYSNEFYKNICGGELEPVKNIILLSKDIHLEITTLMVNEEIDIKEISKFISNIDKDIPFHISRYFPNYKYNKEATLISDMFNAKDTAKKYLNHVYLGNIGGIDNNTYCPNCNELIIKRNYNIEVINKSEVCIKCGYKLKIRGNKK